MAGHKNWSKIKRAKGTLKINMGELFSRLSKEISIAAKLSGGNPAFNPGLLVEISTARVQSIPIFNPTQNILS